MDRYCRAKQLELGLNVLVSNLICLELCYVVRSLSAMAGWIKYLLMTEQKKSDFKPDTEEGPLQMFSTVSTF